MAEQLYFAYGSNMDLDQMEFRCPAAVVMENVRLDGYRLAFCGKNPGCGVATILPEEGSHVDGVLWKITSECERSLDGYEGYPRLYGKETIHVQNAEGKSREVMVYTMNTPYKDHLAEPSQIYLRGILRGCRQNGLPTGHVKEAVRRSRAEERTGLQEAEGIGRKQSHSGEKTGRQTDRNRKTNRER